MSTSTKRFRNGPVDGLEVVRAGQSVRRLTADEVRGLAHRIAAGDCEARNDLVQANLGLVWRAARQYAGRGLAFEDLVGEGSLGLIRASEAFRADAGAQFSTYAMYWIKQAVLRALENASIIRLPAHAGRLLGRWHRTERALARSLGRSPSDEEVAQEMGLNERQQKLVAQARRARNVQLESAFSEEGRPWSKAEVEAAGPRGRSEAELERAEERNRVMDRFRQLGDRERRVVALRFGLEGEGPLNHREISERIGTSRDWARAAERRALHRLAASTGPARRANWPKRPTAAGSRGTGPQPLGPERSIRQPGRRTTSNGQVDVVRNDISRRSPIVRHPRPAASRGAA